VIFLNFFVKSKKNFFVERNLCRVFISLPRVFLLALGKEATLTSVFSGVFYMALGKVFFVERFLFDSGQSLLFR
jgi:hypothetical protein